MHSKPKVGRKILQFAFGGLGGRQFKLCELSSQARKGSSKAIPFEDKEDEDIDAGLDYILKFGPRSTAQMQQLRWQTKSLRNPDSPIYGWPVALVEKALRNLAADGALAKKEFMWPIPLTVKYYHAWLLQILEDIWYFDQSALVLLGEPGAGKSPLGRSILMAQARFNTVHFDVEAEPCIRCTPEIDFLRGEPGSVVMGDFLDDAALSTLSRNSSTHFWTWDSTNPCAGHGGGQRSGRKTKPAPQQTTAMMTGLIFQKASFHGSLSQCSMTWSKKPSPSRQADLTWMLSSNELASYSIPRSTCISARPA